ncbi:MAG: DNA adenine methylase [Thiothrix sp.]|nr:MAG: DNA adenine methylase [Thiothrix sp.]
MRFNTPLRYPGGKGKLTNYIKAILAKNNLLGGVYVEPYTGGAGIALNLLMEDCVSDIYINDLNLGVYSFWHSTLQNSEEMCRLIEETPVTMQEWHNQRSIFENPEKHTLLETAFSTFFLNRTNRSGIIWGGVIGGKDQAGLWKLDARFNKSNLIERIRKITNYTDRINLSNLDASSFIDKITQTLPEKSLIYLDPPYYIKGKGLYQNHYSHNDHMLIAKKVQAEVNLPWIVSYDYTPEILKMYKNNPSIIYGINYSAQKKYTGAEIMFFSKQLKIPEVKNPVNLKIA